MVADVVGYSRLAGADEDGTLARLRGLCGDLIDPVIAAHHGRIVKRTDDGSIIEFRSVVEAVRCAVEVQNSLNRAQRRPAARASAAAISAGLGDSRRASKGAGAMGSVEGSVVWVTGAGSGIGR